MLGIGDVVLLSKQKKAQMLGIGGDVVLLSKQKKAQIYSAKQHLQCPAYS